MSTTLSVGIGQDIDLYAVPKTLASRDPALQCQMRSRAVQVASPAQPSFASPWFRVNEPRTSLATTAPAARPSPTSGSWWLTDTLRTLETIDDEIAEDGLPEIGPAARKEAKRVLAALAWHPRDPTVYPTQDGEIAIQFQSRRLHSSVVILIDNHGHAECYAYTGGRSQRAHYDDASALPDSFVMEQLRALRPEQVPGQVRSAGVGGAAAMLMAGGLACL